MLKPWNIIPGVTCRLHGTGIVLLLLETVAQITNCFALCELRSLKIYKIHTKFVQKIHNKKFTINNIWVFSFIYYTMYPFIEM